MRKFNDESGITLAMLTLTIVVSMILVGVSVKYIISDDGLTKSISNIKNETNSIMENTEQLVDDPIYEQVDTAKGIISKTIENTSQLTVTEKTASSISVKLDMGTFDMSESDEGILKDENGDYLIKYAITGVTQLPSEYQEVEYLESTGTQYIDTDVDVSQIDKLYFEFVPNGILNSWQSYLSGNLDSFTLGATERNITGVYLRFNNKEIFKATNNLNNTKNILNIDENSITLNNNIFSRSGGLGLGNLTIFNNAELSRYSKMKVYSLKVSSDSSDLHKFIPCYCKTTVTDIDGKECAKGTAGLYDTVNGKFYTNQGTGEFSVGNEEYFKSRITGKNSIYECTFDDLISNTDYKIGVFVYYKDGNDTLEKQIAAVSCTTN